MNEKLFLTLKDQGYSSRWRKHYCQDELGTEQDEKTNGKTRKKEEN